METNKQLRRDLECLANALGALSLRVNELEAKAAVEADIISGKEAAKMLGYNYDYVSSTWLGKVGIKYTKGDNGCLKISRKSLEDYLKTRETTTED